MLFWHASILTPTSKIAKLPLRCSKDVTISLSLVLNFLIFALAT